MTSIRVARSFDEVDLLRPAWDQIGWHRPDAEFDFFVTSARTNAGVVRPHVIASLDEDGRPAGFLVARLQHVEFPAAFGYKVLFRPRLRVITVSHGGMAAPAGEIALAQIMAELRDQLAAGEADAVWWPSLPTESAESAAAEKIGARLRRQHFAEVHQHRFLELPESFDAFLASRSRKLRSGIRYTAKRLRAAFGDELVFADLHTSGDTERIACDFEAIAAGTYQRGLGTGFEATPERRALLTLGSQRGWLRAYALYHRDTPIAFWHGWAYRRTYFSSSTGYDPRYAEHRVGIHLLMHVINDLIADPGVDVLDYGFGDAEYKRQYGTSSFPEQDVLVFAPTARGIGVNLVRTGIIGSANLTKRSLDAMGLTDRVKKRWRRWLRERGPA